jgi:hypothetical protein
MSSGIPIRMPGKPCLPRPLKPGKKQSPPCLERMHIDPKPNPRYVLHAQQVTHCPEVSLKPEAVAAPVPLSSVAGGGCEGRARLVAAPVREARRDREGFRFSWNISS